MSLPIIGPLISLADSIFSSWSETRRIQKEGKIRIEEATVNAKVRQLESNDQMDGKLEEISLSQRTWKDEFLMVVAVSPMILAFFPQMVDEVLAGFEVLKQLPEWYMYVVLMVYIDTFGFRRIFRAWLERKVK